MDISRLKDKKVLITGANGLIGRALAAKLLSDCTANPIDVVALVRNETKAKKVFCGLPEQHLEIFVCDICDLLPQDRKVDYIIHCASQTASRKFVEEPVNVINDNFAGTKNILEFARANDVKSVVYLSTMEVYGAPSEESKITESSPSELDTMSVRSCYPESKRICECLCASYASQYGVPAKVVRLTQTFGHGVEYSDKRVFAEFARSVIEKKNIVLKTKGETKRNYLSVDDAVNAILTVLLDGKSGEAYNAANEETYCSVYEMACMVCEKFGNGKIKVKIEESDISRFGYAPTLKMNLSSEKLRAIGWRPKKNLTDMFSETIEYMKEHK